MAVTSTPSNVSRTKKKVKKASPDAVTPSNDKTGAKDCGIRKVPYVSLRRLRPRKKLPTATPELDAADEEISSVQMSTDTDRSSEFKDSGGGGVSIKTQSIVGSKITAIDEGDSDVEITGIQQLDSHYKES